MSMWQRPRPVPDRDSAPWWAAVRRHELTLQRCAGCGTPRFPPRAICNRCHSLSYDWMPAAGTGTVYSWIVNHQEFMPGMAEPFTVVLVRLDDADDILMYGNLASATPATPADLRPGLPVQAVFEDVAADLTLVQWRPQTTP